MVLGSGVVRWGWKLVLGGGVVRWGCEFLSGGCVRKLFWEVVLENAFK